MALFSLRSNLQKAIPRSAVFIACIPTTDTDETIAKLTITALLPSGGGKLGFIVGRYLYCAIGAEYLGSRTPLPKTNTMTRRIYCAFWQRTER